MRCLGEGLWEFKSLSFLFLKGVENLKEYNDLKIRYNLMGYILPEYYLDLNTLNIKENSNLSKLKSFGIESVEIAFDYDFNNLRYKFIFNTDLSLLVNTKSNYVEELDFDFDFEIYADKLGLTLNFFTYSLNIISNNNEYDENDVLICDLLLLTDINRDYIIDFKGKFISLGVLDYKDFKKLYSYGIIPTMYSYNDLLFHTITEKHSFLFSDFDDFLSFATWYKDNSDKLLKNIEIEFQDYELIYSNTSLQILLFYIRKVTVEYKIKLVYNISLHNSVKISERNFKIIQQIRDFGAILNLE